MNIGVDLRPLQGETRYRGIGKSLEFLLFAMSDLADSKHQYVFFVDKGFPVPKIVKLFGHPRIISIATLRLGRTRYVRSVLPSYPPIKPRKKDVDVLLQYDASFGIPKNVPTLSVFHDLIPLLFRAQEKRQAATGLRKAKNALAGQLYWQKYLRTLRQYKKARRIIAISQASKTDLLRYFPDIPKDSIDVVYHGAGHSKTTGKPGKEIQALASHPYILYVGGIDLRKNIVGLAEAFFEVKKHIPDLRLITVGKEFGLSDQLEDLGWSAILKTNPTYAKDIIRPGFLSDSDLALLYERATVFVFPSRYEGFGLPILEAMQAGCPVVAYRNSSIPEVAADAALLVDDGQPLAPALRQILDDPKLRQAMIAKGHEQASKFTWEKTARDTLQALEKTVDD